MVYPIEIACERVKKKLELDIPDLGKALVECLARCDV